MRPDEKTALVKSLGRSLGFDRVGVTPAMPLRRAAHYRDWLESGYAGSMAYLHRNSDARSNPALLLAGAKSVICVALNYKRPPHALATAPTDASAAESAPTGRISSYAQGADYHVVLREMLEALIQQLRANLAEPFDARPYVDTGPLLERELAAAAGLGWIGKNTLLMHETLGSFLFLGEIVTTLDLCADEPVADHCGTCTRCLDACPTHAFPAPYQLDASRCISYFTVEHRAEIPQEIQPKMQDWLFGCDVCQDVCPFNRKSPFGNNADLRAQRLPARLPVLPLMQLRSGEYRRLTNGSAARRATRLMWQRNASIVNNNASLRQAPQQPA